MSFFFFIYFLLGYGLCLWSLWDAFRLRTPLSFERSIIISYFALLLIFAFWPAVLLLQPREKF